MAKKPLVSIIVPVYNVSPYLRECIDSISNQTYSNIEIILINDGSTDDSGKICNEYAKKDERIKVIHKDNEGLNLARKTGFDASSGEYVAFVDSDDIVDKEFTKYLLESLLEHESDMSICEFERFTDRITPTTTGPIIVNYPTADIITAYLTSNPPYDNLLLQTAHMKLLSRKLISEVNWTNSNYRANEDEAMSAYIYNAVGSQTIPIIKNKLYFYRQRPNSIMANLKNNYKNSLNDTSITRYDFLNNICNLRLDLFGQKYEDEILSWFSINYIAYLQKIYGEKEYQPTKKEKTFYDGRFEKITKAHAKYKPFGIYKEMHKAIKDSGNIDGLNAYMKENPIVSIIVPVYNTQDYLSSCIDSLVNQTYANIEIILINDGSTDDSGKICNEYAKKDERIKVIHKDNEGVSIARNIGINHATGEYIAFVDSDDFISSTGLRKLVDMSIGHNLDISVADRIAYYNNGRKVFYTADNIPKDTPIDLKTASEKLLYDLLSCTNVVGVSAKLYKKKLIIDNNIKFPPNIKIGEDFEFLAKALIHASKILYTQYEMYYYRQDPSNAYSATGTIELKKSMDFGRALKNIHAYTMRQSKINKHLSGALRSNVIPQSIYALSIVEGDPMVHEKVFNYIHNDLFPYFKVTLKDTKNENHKRKVEFILDNNYTAFLLNEILDGRSRHQEMEQYVYELLNEVKLSKIDSKDLQDQLDFALSNRGVIRISSGKIKRAIRKLIP